MFRQMQVLAVASKQIISQNAKRTIVTTNQIKTPYETNRKQTKSKSKGVVIFDKDGTLFDTDAGWIMWAELFANKVANHMPSLEQQKQHYNTFSAKTSNSNCNNGSDNVNKSDVGKSESTVTDPTEKVHKLMKRIGYCHQTKMVGGILASMPWDIVKQKLHDMAVEETLGNLRTAQYEAIVKECDGEVFSDTSRFHHPLFDVGEVFDILRTSNYKIAICTADYSNPTHQALKKYNLTSMVDMVVGCDSGFDPKPNPRVAHAICRNLDVPANKSAMVGDTVVDMQLGNAADFAHCIAVLSGAGTEEEFANIADHIALNASAVPKLVLPENAPSHLRKKQSAKLNVHY